MTEKNKKKENIDDKQQLMNNKIVKIRKRN